ncbi:MAG: phosphoenolpyruvate synthase [Sphingobacteriales bacterium]|nr:MAG: phosphoenolpyruvate synthase [Sphingobacteriales bacterium]
MSRYTLSFKEVGKAAHNLVGGKGANLGELSKLKGIQVPDGFCITTDAYKTMFDGNAVLDNLLHELELLKPTDLSAISKVAAQLREAIEQIPVADVIVNEIAERLRKLGVYEAYAVRSSATAEDLPTASFAGQQDTYLNIMGKAEILKYISKCWASLFTDRAVIYRMQNGFDHRKVQISVVVQKMVFPLASGILFTADPVSSNRKVISIDAGFGLGEALVSGLVNADVYKVNDGVIIDKNIATKMLALYALEEGGTEERELHNEQQNAAVLTDEQILALAQLGRMIEQHFGRPQDIEWCLADGAFYIVQSRPITTLFPVPEVTDGKNHVYLSVGHQQMMTDPIKPLGMSFFRMTAQSNMPTAGGRLFADVTAQLASPTRRHVLVNVLGKTDLLTKGALENIIERGYIETIPDDPQQVPTGRQVDYNVQIAYDPALVTELIRNSEEAIKALKEVIQTKRGLELLDFIREHNKKSVSDPRSLQVIMTAMNATIWVNEKMNEWLGEKSVADTLTQSVPNNITAQMGHDLLQVADAMRPYKDVVAYLQSIKQHDDFLNELPELNGGQAAKDAIATFLHKYGMRCAGEIDITRPRWVEQPATLIPAILGNIKNFRSGEGDRRFQLGLQKALAKEQELLSRLKELPDGVQKATEAQQKMELIRNYSGYREYPKYFIVSRYFMYKQALLKEAECLLADHIISNKEDIYYLSFDELYKLVRTHEFDQHLIDQRKEDYKWYEKLTPPRVMTSDGEVLTGKFSRDDLPEGAIVGLPVSSGIVEGRARVILKMEDADLQDGDILVTKFTDPSWTPVFISIKSLITEVGGLMTHGAVIAREYGLPAVVSVERATQIIKDGQRIRVNGTDGFIELLD